MRHLNTEAFAMNVLRLFGLLNCLLIVISSNHTGMMDMDRLNSDLLKNYSVMTPAFSLLYGNRTVIIDMNLEAIHGINEREQIFSFSANIQITWQDQRLKWNPSAYGNISSIQLGSEYIWSPKFFILNSADMTTDLNTNLPAFLEASGIISIGVYAVFKTSCSLNTAQYPFDTQSCALYMSGPRGAIAKVVLREPNIVLKQLMAVASEWKLLNITYNVSNAGYDTEINIARFCIVMERKSVFYVASTIFPMFLLSFLTPLVFLFPPESGEKLSYLISIFVSYAVFLNFINDTMPRTSESICNLEGYLICVLVHCVSAILATLAFMKRNSNKSPAKSDNSQDGGQNIRCCGLIKHSQVSPGSTVLESENKLCKRDWVLFGLYFISAFLLLIIFQF